MSLLLLAAQPVHAQASAATEDEASSEIVVTARRSGAPIWEVRSGPSTVLLVGEIDEVPRTSAWQPEGLEEATRQADRVILGVATKATVGDVLRLLFRGGSLTRLPDGRTADAYLDAHQLRRLSLLEQRYRQNYARQSFLLTAHDILTKRLGLGKRTADNATDVVREVTRRDRKPTRPVGSIRVRAVFDDLFAAPPQSHIACLGAAMNAADAGTDSVDDRGWAWSHSDIPALMTNPVEVALGRCWPWNSAQIGPELRGQWRVAISEALSQPGTTLAVVPIRVLAEPDGLLDELERTAVEMYGPAW